MNKTKVLIAGGTGLIGSRLIELLPSEKYDIHILSRSPIKNFENIKYFKWDPSRNFIDKASLEGINAVVNLAGAGIADKKWTVNRKKLILDSRVLSCQTLATTIREMDIEPSIYFGASAIGFYGDRGNTKLTESDSKGKGFLADVTNSWEKENRLLGQLFQRSILLRIGIVLSTKGGALKEIIKPAKMGMYGYFGNGSAYYSWIHIDDIVKIIISSIADETFNGIYNGTAPQPETIRQLVKAVKQSKRGFGIMMPVPKMALQAVMGEMANMLFNSTRVIPQNLLDKGFEFDFPDLVSAVKDLLDRKI